jgi:hypothetical protein
VEGDMTVEIIAMDDILTKLDAEHYKWYFDKFLVFTYGSMSFFDVDNIKQINIDGVPIIIPDVTGTDI